LRATRLWRAIAASDRPLGAKDAKGAKGAKEWQGTAHLLQFTFCSSLSAVRLTQRALSDRLIPRSRCPERVVPPSTPQTSHKAKRLLRQAEQALNACSD